MAYDLFAPDGKHLETLSQEGDNLVSRGKCSGVLPDESPCHGNQVTGVNGAAVCVECGAFCGFLVAVSPSFFGADEDRAVFARARVY